MQTEEAHVEPVSRGIVRPRLLRSDVWQPRSFAHAVTFLLKIARIAVISFLSLAVCESAACSNATSIQYLGQTVMPHAARFAESVIGGLSGISYDPQQRLYYVISDDKSTLSSARFYTVRMSVSEHGLDEVQLVAMRSLRDRPRQVFSAATSQTQPVPPDPEGIAFDARRQRLYWSSEGAFEPARTGEPAIVLNPSVRIAGLDGSYLGEFTMPPGFNMAASGNAGPRPNQSLEGVALSPDGRFLFAAMEDPLYEDGPNPDLDRAALVRITKFDVESRTAVAQYAYPLDLASPPLETNGLSDLVALTDSSFLVVERSGSDKGVGVRIYRADIDGATDVLRRPSLVAPAVLPMFKSLVTDLTTTPGLTPLDNIEGITLGPRLRDERYSVVLVSDDNFLPSQVTQFVAFAM
jgi:hypothetical protein